MKALTRDQQNQFNITAAQREAQAAAGALSIKNVQKSPMVEFLSDTRIEGWRPSEYIPATAVMTEFPDGTERMYNKSGVTVGNGADVGQTSRKEMLDAGVLPYIVDKLQVHGAVGSKDQAAIMALGNLERSSQSLTLDEVTHISNKMTAASTEGLRNRMPAGRWDEMNDAEQGAVTSLRHLYGPSFYGHKAFTQAVKGDWKGLYNNMQNYSTKTTLHDGRNRYVADTLRPSMEAQTLAEAQQLVEK